MSPLIKSSYFLKISSAFCLGFVRETVKRRILISNISMGKLTLCHGQQISRYGLSGAAVSYCKCHEIIKLYAFEMWNRIQICAEKQRIWL
jgi:hypothetical protein